MDATATISLIAISLSLATFITIRLNRAENENLRQRLANHRRLAELQFGDVVEIPAAAKSGGGTAAQGSSRVAQDTMDRTHVGAAK